MIYLTVEIKKFHLLLLEKKHSLQFDSFRHKSYISLQYQHIFWVFKSTIIVFFSISIEYFGNSMLLKLVLKVKKEVDNWLVNFQLWLICFKMQCTVMWNFHKSTGHDKIFLMPRLSFFETRIHSAHFFYKYKFIKD